MREHHLRSADGTRIKAWQTESSGPDVLLCPGLGTMPEAWPALGRADLGARVHGWYHRGTLGSDRPADETRITSADHLADAVAVLDTAGVRRCVVMGWSAGVTVACELARQYPDLVSGLLLVAGSPGDVFGGMFGVLGMPLPVSRAVGRTTSRVLRDTGPLVDAVLHRLPVNALTAALARHSGLLRPTSANADVVAAARRFVGHDWGWYGRLALALAEEPPAEVSGIHCPVTVLTGRYDLLIDPRHAMRGLATLPQVRTRMLPTSHFLPLEAPDELADELHLLLDRAEAVRGAAHWRELDVPAQPVRRPEPDTHSTLTWARIP
ncbi:MAG TPA: alpha/beta hydrolase [Pseudonocardiaceae bacterium]|nr:alpha/beta hydrolase [Pseudonocardiaceae bacterium]